MGAVGRFRNRDVMGSPLVVNVNLFNVSDYANTYATCGLNDDEKRKQSDRQPG